jgi:hypothetical protein
MNSLLFMVRWDFFLLFFLVKLSVPQKLSLHVLLISQPSVLLAHFLERLAHGWLFLQVQITNEVVNQQVLL